ncbi:MAG TPA: hypothetical protein VFS40_11705 [Gemmatimonadales bacterium]|nr:hypothetical protein [Gemmatimonadales bacterium]
MPTATPTTLARRALGGLGLLACALSTGAGRAWAQGAVDPGMAPRAAALERQGDRALATEMLGRYLAVAPDDGQAWFQLGRFYLIDARSWHQRGHRGDPPGPLYLDFAVTAFDQSIRLDIDSALVYRGIAEMERARVFVEDSGWAAARQRRPRTGAPALPAFILELGDNLLNSCPTAGVLLTGGELETVAVWYQSLEAGHRQDLLPLRPELYALDAEYRGQMARSLGVDSALSVQKALAAVAARRPVCLTPSADSAALPGVTWTPVRLVRVSRAAPLPDDAVVTVTEFVRAAHDGNSAWLGDVRAIYYTAARRNPVLCRGLIPLVGGDVPRCGP